MNRPDLIESVALAVTSALGVGILEAAALAALAFAFIRISRPSATTRHVLWWIALAAGIALPLVSIAGSLGHIEHRVPASGAWVAPDTDRTANASGPTTARIWSTSPAASGRKAESGPPQQAAATDALLASVTRFFSSLAAAPHLALTLVAVWLAVALGGLALLARSLFALATIKRASLPLDESVVRRLRRWRHSTRLGRSVELRVSHDVDVPVAVGFRTPTILLPLQVVETEEIADLDQIAMHEYAHLDRYDDWTNLLQRIVERVFWFSPVVLFVGRQISLEREIACDDWVVAQTGRAHRYATCLWKLVESARLPAKPIVAPGALLSPKQITKRIEQLLDSRRNALPRLSPVGAIALGALGIVLVIVQAQRAPVIAVEDIPLPVPAVATVPPPHVVEPRRIVRVPALPAVPATAPRVVMHDLATPWPETPRYERVIVMHVAPDATPQALATEMARTLSKHYHSVVKATVERTIREQTSSAVQKSVAAADAVASSAAEAAKSGEQVGLDIAKTVATTVADSVAGGTWGDAQPGALDRETLKRCFGCNLRGRDLRGIDLHAVSLTGDDLRGADLRGVDLSGAKLVGVDLRDAKLDGANLSNAALSGCDLRGTSLANANLDGLHLTGTSIRGTTIGGSRLRSIVDRCMGCDLRELDLRGQDLHGIELFGADLRDADLRGANLRHARLQGVDLRGARLAGADLTDAELNGCNLDGVDLNDAKTQGMKTNDVGLEGLKRLALASHRLDTASHHLQDDYLRLHASLHALSETQLASVRGCKLHKLMAP
jgi:uncharacterized protein YjbI with pentapeptide repeats/beta-lactamase regulating signal transducer with metallopeptidase domain